MCMCVFVFVCRVGAGNDESNTSDSYIYFQSVAAGFVLVFISGSALIYLAGWGYQSTGSSSLRCCGSSASTKSSAEQKYERDKEMTEIVSPTNRSRALSTEGLVQKTESMYDPVTYDLESSSQILSQSEIPKKVLVFLRVVPQRRMRMRGGKRICSLLLVVDLRLFSLFVC